MRKFAFLPQEGVPKRAQKYSLQQFILERIQFFMAYTSIDNTIQKLYAQTEKSYSSVFEKIGKM